ncbi:hypothetical protein GCM10027570_25910 [Streptomonospora sediminis]
MSAVSWADPHSWICGTALPAVASEPRHLDRTHWVRSSLFCCPHPRIPPRSGRVVRSGIPRSAHGRRPWREYRRRGIGRKPAGAGAARR